MTRESGHTRTGRGLAWAMGAAAASGFVSLSYEIVWYRVYAYTSGGTLPVFGIFLGTYLAGMAAGALLAGRTCQDQPKLDVAKLAGYASVLALAGGALAHLHTPIAALAAAHGRPMGALAAAGVGAGLYGAILPLVTHVVVAPSPTAGRGVSRVYLASIAGASLGSGLTGFVLLDILSTQAVSTLLLAVSGGLALLLWAGRGATSRPSRASAGAGAVAAVLATGLFLATPALYDRLWERLLWKRPEADRHPFAQLIETRAGVVAVTEGGIVFGGGVYDGRVNVRLDPDTNGIVRAYALSALHPSPRRVLMIGLGSGSWAQVLAHHPGVESLTVVEINRGYLDVVRAHEEVRSLLDHPHVTIAIDDGRRWLTAARGRKFDAIVSNTSFHWRANASHLLSTEFLALAREHLAPGGIVYYNTTSSPVAERTACVHFASGLRFVNWMAAADHELTFDPERMAEAIRTWKVDGESPLDGPAETWLARTMPGLLDPETLEPCPSILARTEGLPIVTDDNLASEAAAPWNWLYFPGPPPR